MSMQTQSVVEIANGLLASHSKNELVVMARSLGWKGDQARTPILVFALFIASKAGEDVKQPQGELKHEREDDPAKQAKERADKRAELERQLAELAGELGGEEKGQKTEDQAEQSDNQGEQSDNQGEQPGFEQAPQAPQNEPQQPQQPKAESEPTQDQKQPQNRAKEPEQPDSREPEDQPEDDRPKQGHSDEFAKLVKHSGIKRPHRLLEKVWRLTVKGGLNVMLSGPAGSGKTTLAHQLSQLLTVPFASISCTAGMSESQLTGWLLPIGESGRFDYVQSPFVRSIQQPSVFLLDELDAADANVVLSMNSLLANGFLTVSHKLDNPTIERHVNSVIIAGVNSVGGGDDVYTARTILDGSTLDRFYIVSVDYDEAYESELFNRSKRAGMKSPKWEANPFAVDQTAVDELRKYFFKVRRKAEASQIRQIVSTRFAQKLLAAADCGIPFEEIKQDLLASWTTDERAHVKGL